MKLKVGDEVLICDYSWSLAVKDGELVPAYGQWNHKYDAVVLACCGLVLPQQPSNLDPTERYELEVLVKHPRPINNVIVRRLFDNLVIFIPEQFLVLKQPS